MQRRVEALLLRRLVDLTNATSRSQRDSIATDATGTMATVSQDVELAAYESSTTGKPQFGLTARAGAIRHVRALMESLLLLSNEQRSATRTVAHRLDALANELSNGSRWADVPVPRNGNDLSHARSSRTVDGFVMADLELLESAFVRRSGG